MENTLELLQVTTKDTAQSSFNQTCAEGLIIFFKANHDIVQQFDTIASIQIFLGAIGTILGAKVLKGIIMNYKNAITITMVMCCVWYSLMMLFQGVFMLARKTINTKLFIILYKLSFYGVCVIICCDFLVATLYLNNAVSLNTSKISSSLLNKICLSAWIFFSIALVTTIIIDCIGTIKFF